MDRATFALRRPLDCRQINCTSVAEDDPSQPQSVLTHHRRHRLVVRDRDAADGFVLEGIPNPKNRQDTAIDSDVDAALCSSGTTGLAAEGNDSAADSVFPQSASAWSKNSRGVPSVGPGVGDCSTGLGGDASTPPATRRSLFVELLAGADAPSNREMTTKAVNGRNTGTDTTFPLSG